MGRSMPLALVVSLCTSGAAAQGLPDRVAALEARMTAVEAAATPEQVSVDCTAGQTVGAVLAQYGRRGGTLFIMVSGVCAESLLIFRDQVAILGTGPGAAITAPAAPQPALRVLGGAGIFLSNLSLSADGDALVVERDGAVAGTNVRISSPMRAVTLRGANIDLRNSTLQGSPTSTAVGQSGLFAIASTVRLLGVTVQDFAGGPGLHIEGGSADVRNSTLHHLDRGIRAVGASVSLSTTTVGQSANWGIELEAGSTLRMIGGAVADNATDGVRMTASTAMFESGVRVENNGGPGIRAMVNSSVGLSSITITGNGGGMQLSDGAVAFVPATPGAVQITGNDRGVICLGSPSGSTLAGNISAFGSGFHLNAGNVFGNGPLGPNISCPGILVP